MDGVHLEAIGVNKWRLTGQAMAILRMEEIVVAGAPSIKWIVENGGVVARYSTAGVALGHAYQLAKGHSPRQAEAY